MTSIVILFYKSEKSVLHMQLTNGVSYIQNNHIFT